MGWTSQLLDVVLVMLGCIVIILVAFAFSMYRWIASLLRAKAMNEMRSYIDETGKEAYSFARSLHPQSDPAETLERAVDYMRRQFAERRVHFDYEHARAVIEKAALQADAYRRCCNSTMPKA